MSADFEGPPHDDSISVYVPLIFSQADMSRRTHSMRVIGRLADGISADEARVHLSLVAKNIAASDPGSNPEVSVRNAQEELVEKVRLGLFVLLGTVGFVLLIACANVANLLLARGTSRLREVAIRSSLGAGGRRIVRQFFTENVVLAAIGGAAGFLLAIMTLRVLVAIGPPDLPQLKQVRMDGSVPVFVMAVSLITSVVFGLIPMFHLVRADLGQKMKRGKHFTWSALVIFEVAASLMLLTGAGLMIRSLMNIQAVDLGFRPERTITTQVFLNSATYPIDNTQFAPLRTDGPRPTLSKPARFFAEVIDRIKALPGVESAGAVSALPLNVVGIDFDLPVVIEGQPNPKTGEEPQADFRIATPDYFRAMGIRVLRGRPFNDLDGPDAPSVAVVNDAFVRQMFGSIDPVGKRLQLYGRPREIVGVVGSVRHRSFGIEPRAEMYLPSRQFTFSGMTLVVRGSVDPVTLIPAIKRAAHDVDSNQPIYRFRTLDEYVSDSVAQPRFTTLLLVSFAGLAVVLAVIGIYGLISYSVVQRTREIGIRIALGSSRTEVLYMVLRQGLRLTGIGIAAGLVGSLTLSSTVSRLLFGVTATDPMTYVAVTATLLAVAVIATLIPAKQAMLVDPLVALRHE
jgi:putative ABC transport system permease protein